jgi:hypothetical protein
MKRWLALTILAIVAGGQCGCQTMRAIDQWKCDNLGWCCFGTQPSQPQPQPVYLPAAAPIVSGSPCATPCTPLPAPCAPVCGR